MSRTIGRSRVHRWIGTTVESLLAWFSPWCPLGHIFHLLYHNTCIKSQYKRSMKCVYVDIGVSMLDGYFRLVLVVFKFEKCGRGKHALYTDLLQINFSFMGMRLFFGMEHAPVGCFWTLCTNSSESNFIFPTFVSRSAVLLKAFTPEIFYHFMFPLSSFVSLFIISMFIFALWAWSIVSH